MADRDSEYVALTNSLLAFCRVPASIRSLQECNPSMFVLLVESLFQVRIPGIIRSPGSYIDQLNNSSRILGFLNSHNLPTDISNISADDLAHRKPDVLRRLLDVLSALQSMLERYEPATVALSDGEAYSGTDSEMGSEDDEHSDEELQSSAEVSQASDLSEHSDAGDEQARQMSARHKHRLDSAEQHQEKRVHTLSTGESVTAGVHQPLPGQSALLEEFARFLDLRRSQVAGSAADDEAAAAAGVSERPHKRKARKARRPHAAVAPSPATVPRRPASALRRPASASSASRRPQSARRQAEAEAAVRRSTQSAASTAAAERVFDSVPEHVRRVIENRVLHFKASRSSATAEAQTLFERHEADRKLHKRQFVGDIMRQYHDAKTAVQEEEARLSQPAINWVEYKQKVDSVRKRKQAEEDLQWRTAQQVRRSHMQGQEFVRVFNEVLRQETDRATTERRLLKEAMLDEAKRREEAQEAKERYYREQFGMAQERLQQERRERMLAERAQRRAIERMQREMRHKMASDTEAVRRRRQQIDEVRFKREVDALAQAGLGRALQRSADPLAFFVRSPSAARA